MSTQYIQKKAAGTETSPTSIGDDTTGKSIIRNLSRAAGLAYDRAANFIKYNGNDAIKTLVDAESAQTISGVKTFSGASVLSGGVSITGATISASTISGNIHSDIIVQAASQTIDNSSTLAALSTPALWTVVAAKTYVFEFDFPVTCTTNGGIAVGFTLATATLTSIRYNFELHSAVDKTDAIGGTGTTTTSGTKMVADKSVAWTRVRVQGSFVVNAGGTFSFTVSQETAATGGDVSAFLIGGTSRVIRVV